jgi:hypothetical protein
LGSSLLHGFPPEKASYAAHVLLRAGPFESVYRITNPGPPSAISVKTYSRQFVTTNFLSGLRGGSEEDTGTN